MDGKLRGDCWFYNIGPGRATSQVNREMRAILGTDPLVLGLCETIGYGLPSVRGYDLIRSVRRPGRANIAAYVSTKPSLSKVIWHDLFQTWPRTETHGMHPARSWLEFYLSDVQFCVAHQPPKVKSGKDTLRTQSEGIRSYTEQMAPWTNETLWYKRSASWRVMEKTRTRIMLWDPNRGPSEPGPGPKKLAEDISGRIVGRSNIDAAVVRNAEARRAFYPKEVGGVKLLSDHHHAFKTRLVEW